MQMGTMGRPRHPDILTPREWEVLALLRERRTNEQIASHLGITLDGAKYHVSQILSKLGVATREEAAAWRPPEVRRGWWARWPLWAKIAGAGTMAAAAAGLAVMVWAAIEIEGPAEVPPDVGALPELEVALTEGRRISFEECGSNRAWQQPSFEDIVTDRYLTGVPVEQVRQAYDRRFFTVVGDGALSANRGWLVSAGLEGDRTNPPWPPSCPVRDVFRIYLVYHQALEVRQLDNVLVVLVLPMDKGYSAINLFSLPDEGDKGFTVYFVSVATGLLLDCIGASCNDLATVGAGLPTSSSSLRTGDLLLTRNRGSLAICVQSVGLDDGVERAVARQVEDLLPELEAHRNWVPSGLATGAPIVRTDCSSEPTLLASNADLKSGNPLLVEAPSMYRLFVFVLPQADIDRIFQWQFGRWPIRSVAQELVRESNARIGSTTAIYLSPEEAAESAFLREWLTKGIGLEPVVPIDQ